MTLLPIYNKIFVILIDFIAVWLTFLVYFNNPKGKLNRIFRLMAIFMLLWVNFAFLARVIGMNNLLLAELFLHVAWFVTPLFFVTLYLLITELLKEEKKHNLLTKGVLFTGIILAFATGFTKWIVAGVMFVNEILRITYGSWMFPFLGGILFIMCATLYLLFKGYLKGSSEERKKIDYFIFGALIFYLANIIFNITLPIFYNIARFYFIGDYSTLILLSFIAYAILKKELFGVRIILTQFLVVIIAILLLAQAVTAIGWLEFIWKFSLFLAFVYFGYLLFKSVTREIQQREEIERLSNAKSEFISIASHQLRTPLAAIKGYISMILEGTYGKLPQKAKKPIENVYDSNEKLVKLVNDLLSFSRIESGKIEIEKEKTSIGDLISNIVEIFQVEAKNKGLYLKFEKGREAFPEILVDSDKIRDAVSNLINNAIKYTLKGGITVKLKNVNGKIQIEVRDTGVGMTKEEISRLFQSFARGAAGSKLYSQGTGLGLYIAKKYVEMHGGALTVVSPGPGKGTTFTIELPVK